MDNTQILFVVGAGASSEANLPTGEKLKDSIADKINFEFDDHLFGEKLLSGDRGILDALIQHAGRIDGQPGNIIPYLEAGQLIRNAMPNTTSIDNFIDNHYGNKKIEVLGKLAIVQCVLEAERSSPLFCDPRQPASRPKFEALKGTWYSSLMKLLTEGCRKEDIATRLGHISFITFNYDRCIEQFLFFSLQNQYGIPTDEAASYMASLRNIHPYGTVGCLPWQNPNAATSFGDSAYGDDLLNRAGQIMTFTERLADEEKMTEMHDLVRKANIIVFLGFAFHKQNMELISVLNTDHAKRVFATAIGISNSDCNAVSHDILNRFGGGTTELRNDLRCSELFNEYWRSLTLS